MGLDTIVGAESGSGSMTSEVILTVRSPNAPKLDGLDTTMARLDALMAKIKLVNGMSIGGMSAAKSVVQADIASAISAGARSGFSNATSQAKQFAKNIRISTPPVSPAVAGGAVSNRDMLENIKNVTTWGASIAVLYGALNVAKFSMASLINTGLQVARLQQVFTGPTEQIDALRNSVLGLAADYGRTSDEALAAAVSWSRMGLKFAAVNEAVRVSLLASNVAEMSAAEATNHLQALMQTYGLRVSELAGVLGGLNQISNIYNVTVNDLLTGLSRVSSVAAQAGLPLVELAGLMAATVGRTKQSGANIGNALKSVITGMGNPAIQSFLKGMGIDVRTQGTDELKDMSTIIRELYLRYTEMTKAEQQWLTFRVAGKTQAARFTAMLDGYVKSQYLAISAQLNLNSAEAENTLITNTLHNSLTGLVTEWEKFVSIQGNRGPVQAMTEITKGFRGLIAAGNTGIGSGASTAILGLMTVMGAKMAVTAITMKTAAGATGMLANSLRHLAAAWAMMGRTMDLAVGSFITKKFGPDSSATFLGRGAGGTVALLSGISIASKEAATGLRSAYVGAGLGMRFMGASAAMALTAVSGLTRVLAVALVGLWEFALPIAAIYGGLWLWNKASDALGITTHRVTDELSLLSEKAERADKASKGHLQTARLIETLQKRQANMPQSEWNAMGADLSKAGIDINGDLEKQRQSAILRSWSEAGKAIEIQKSIIAKSKAGLDVVREGPKKEKLQEALKDAELALTAAVIERNQVEENGLSMDVRKLSILSAQAEKVRLISDIYSAMPTTGRADRALLEANALESQATSMRKFLDSTMAVDRETNNANARQTDENNLIDRVIKSKQQSLALRTEEANKTFIPNYIPKSGYDDKNKNPLVLPLVETPEMRSLAAQISALESRKKALDSNILIPPTERAKYEDQTKDAFSKAAGIRNNMPSYRMIDQANLAKTYAGMDADRNSFGANRTEELVNRKKYLDQRIQNPDLSSRNGQFQAQENLNDSYKTSLALVARRVELQKEEYSIILKQGRSYKESLLMSGPAELLRKMTAFKAANRPGGLGLGEFMAMSPEMRRDVGEANPKYSPEFRANRDEQNSLNRSGMGREGLTEMQSGQRMTQDLIAAVAAKFQIPSMSALSAPIELVSRSLGILSGNLIEAAGAVETFKASMASPGRGETPKQAAPQAKNGQMRSVSPNSDPYVPDTTDYTTFMN